MKYKDYYKILGIERAASDDDIKKAYRRLARKFHPDVSKEKNAEERFKEIGEAYEVLKDTEKRAAYDRLGQHGAGEEFRPPPGWGEQYARGAGGFGQYTNANVDLGDLFAELFGGAARRGQPGAGFAIPGHDYEAVVQLDLEQVYRGTEVTLNVDATDHGFDGMPRRAGKSVTVRIPKGATDGQKLRVPGKGGPGVNGGPAGSLYLDIRLRPHPLFKVSGHDLYLDLPIAPWEGALGAQVEVPTLDGEVRLKIAPGASSAQKLRLAGKGLPKPDGTRGDLYAVLQVVNPPAPSARERELFEELQRASSFNPRAKLARGSRG